MTSSTATFAYRARARAAACAALAFTCLALTAPADSAARARVTLTPAGAAGAATVSLTGARFAPRALVTVNATGLAPRRRRVSARGAFAVRLPLPGGSRRTLRVVTRSGRVRVVSLFRRGGARDDGEVAAAGGAALRWRVLGRTVTLTGRGFARGRAVTVRAAGRSVAFRADAHGRIAGPLSLPASAPLRVNAVARSAGIALPFPIRLAPAAAQPALPIRAAFYYPWFPQAWSQRGIDPFTHFSPSSGFYSSADPVILRRHVDQLLYANVEAGLVSWFGQGTRSDARVPALLDAAHGTPLRWALYHEGEGQGDPDVASIRADLVYIRDHYAADPAYLRVHGRPVLFVYGDAQDGPATAARWRQANDLGFYLVLKVFPGYRAAPDQPAGWHQYAPANAQDEQAGQSFAVSPGFWHAAEAEPRLQRDLQRFSASVRAMVASGAPWQLVTTFNEWGEGTAVEPAWEWSTPSGYGAYLDALHRDGG